MKRVCRVLLLLLIVFTFENCNPQEVRFACKGRIDYITSAEEEKFLDSLQFLTFQYFLKERNPELGLVKDRTADWAAASIAATGFSIPVYASGVERGWVTREKAAEITLTILKYFVRSEQSAGKNSAGYKGFYYHFLDMKTGKRTWNCELSTIDTGLLIAGIIFARQYYNQDSDIEKEIRSAASQIIDRLDWNFFTMKNDDKYKNSISMGWYPEKGFHDMGWTGYNEALILYIMAAGGNLKDPVSAYDAWLKGYDFRTPYPGLNHAVFPPMFGHQYSQMFIDFRKLTDKKLKTRGLDYFENSRRATLVQREYAIQNPQGWKGYDSLSWGLTACDGPGEKYNTGNKKFLSYAGRGTSGPDLVYFDDGTIAPTAAAGSIVFAPEIVIPTLINISKKYCAEGIWGKYGMYDSFNPTLNWINNDYIGIDQGPIILMIENFKSGLVWKYFMKDPLIQKGLEKLGFEYLK